MNVVFMGTPDFAVTSLEKIYESGHNILGVVCQTDKPSGRGMKLTSPPVKEYAVSNNLKVFQPEKIRKNVEFIEEIKSLKPDVIVVVAYGKILPKEILEIPKYGCINVHGSLLPKYRGSAPIQWAIIKGEKKTGVTTMYMDEGMDTGDMLLKEEIEIGDNDTYGTLYEKLKMIGGNLIVKTLDGIADGILNREKQSDDYSMAPMIEKSMGKIDWSDSSKNIRNLIRGLNPMPVAYTFYNNAVMKIWRADIANISKNEQVVPGTIVESNSKEGIIVATGDGFLKLTEVQMQNAKRMLATELLRGNKIEVGSILN